MIRAMHVVVDHRRPHHHGARRRRTCAFYGGGRCEMEELHKGKVEGEGAAAAMKVGKL
uniref:Uncharacterized protein n=1 Tax=Arundo donax TaxID=35708 RepID=A0A0A9AGG6_ARUDO